MQILNLLTHIKIFNPVNLVFLLLSIQSIRPTYFGKTINDRFQFILITFIITEW